jgi:hypothetical protein
MIVATRRARFLLLMSAPTSQIGWFVHALLGAGILGGIGFIGGFFGPMIFAPEANQGPLLGIFITGPLGAILGGIGGALVGWWRNRR